MVSFDMRMMELISKLEDKYKNLKDIFYQKLDTQYQPRVVVDEDNDDELDYDGWALTNPLSPFITSCQNEC